MNNPDSIVTARVPREIRDQGEAALKKIDSSVTELINTAFECVIKTGKLPIYQRTLNSDEKTVRRFDTVDAKEQFIQSLKATSLPMSSEYALLSAQDIKAMRLAERYEDHS